MYIIFYAVLLYIGIGLQIGGLYIFMTDLPKLLNNEIKITNISEFIKYLIDQLIRIAIASIIWPKTIISIVQWFKNIKTSN